MLQTTWYLYLIECADGSLYTGIATDVARRFQEHLSGKGARFTRSRKAIRLVASRPIGSRSEALRAEIAIKRLPKVKKAEAVRAMTSISIHEEERHDTMNKSELIEIAAKEADITKAAAEKVLAAIIGAITKAVSKGDSVALIGFGSFKASKRAARTGVNPKTGEKLKIAATTVPRFTAGAGFKAAVAGKKAAKKK
jgi:DNA-binding protein HU-beta